MYLADLVGTSLTLAGMVCVFAGGLLLALLLLKQEAEHDPLMLAVASLICAMAQAVAVAIVLGAMEILRFSLALALQATLTALLYALVRRNRDCPKPVKSISLLVDRAWVILRRNPLLAFCVFQVGTMELLRGLIWPPLSWDSWMHHLWPPTHWIHTESLSVLFGPVPQSIFGYVSEFGGLWLWWWMAPSHSELYFGLAYAPSWVLLGLSTGAVARELGAKRHWPSAAMLVLIVPTVIRYLGTQYVDIMLAAMVVAACFFGLRWTKSAGFRHALLTATALGLAAGTKTSGLLFGLLLVLSLLATTRGQFRLRLKQVSFAFLLFIVLGGYFYARNTVQGVGALHPWNTPFSNNPCARNAGLGALEPDHTVWAQISSHWSQGHLSEGFLGMADESDTLTREEGIGPMAAMLLFATLALPVCVPRQRRLIAIVVSVQILGHLIFWFTLPAVKTDLQEAMRYLDSAVGLSLAALFVMLENRGLKDGWIRIIALGLAVQCLLHNHDPYPRVAWLLLIGIDLMLVILLLSSALRQWIRRYWRWVSGCVAVTLLSLSPAFAEFRTNSRAQVFGRPDLSSRTSIYPLSGALAWMDRHCGDGAVAVVGAPANTFAHLATGMRLQRRVVYVNIKAENGRTIQEHPNCNPRLGRPSSSAWLENLDRSQARWLWIHRTSKKYEFPVEEQWAKKHAERFRLLYKDHNSRIFEVVRPAPDQATPPGAVGAN